VALDGRGEREEGVIGVKERKGRKRKGV